MVNIIANAVCVVKTLAGDRPNGLLGSCPAADHGPQTEGDGCTAGRQLTLLDVIDGSIVPHHESAGNDHDCESEEGG